MADVTQALRDARGRFVARTRGPVTMRIFYEQFIPNEMIPTRRELYQVNLMFLMKDRRVFPFWRWRYVRCWLGAQGWVR